MKKIFMLMMLPFIIKASSFICDVTVIKSEPVYKTVIKKLPHKECWEETYASPLCKFDCRNNIQTVAQKTTLTKCRTRYTDKKENVLIGYNNMGKVCGGTQIIKKFSRYKLKIIRTTTMY